MSLFIVARGVNGESLLVPARLPQRFWNPLAGIFARTVSTPRFPVHVVQLTRR